MRANAACDVIPWSERCAFTSAKIFAVSPCRSRRWRKFRIGSRQECGRRLVRSRQTGASPHRCTESLRPSGRSASTSSARSTLVASSPAEPGDTRTHRWAPALWPHLRIMRLDQRNRWTQDTTASISTRNPFAQRDFLLHRIAQTEKGGCFGIGRVLAGIPKSTRSHQKFQVLRTLLEYMSISTHGLLLRKHAKSEEVSESTSTSEPPLL